MAEETPGLYRATTLQADFSGTPSLTEQLCEEARKGWEVHTYIPKRGGQHSSAEVLFKRMAGYPWK